MHVHNRLFLVVVSLCLVLFCAACMDQPSGSTGVKPTPTALSPLLNKNLIVNGGAEDGSGTQNIDTLTRPIPGWKTTGPITVLRYGAASEVPGDKDPGPSDHGKNFFWGGPDIAAPGEDAKDNTTTSATQTIDLSSLARWTEKGQISYALSAYLGGSLNKDDNATLTVEFRDAAGKTLTTAKLGPVKAADRFNKTLLSPRGKGGKLPAQTRSAVVTLVFTKTAGSNNEAAADNLSLVLEVQL